jgi:transposase
MSKMQPNYDELLSIITQLQAQNALLQAQNIQLQAQNIQLQAQNIQLQAQVETLQAEIRDLKEKLNTNSSNSSKPPSQDPYRAPIQKKKTGKKQGAQPGHPGHRRRLYPLEQVQSVLDLRPLKCPKCKSQGFDDQIISTDVRQVLELPEAPPEVTQYNIHTCRCSECGNHVKANIPPEAQYGFGARLMGLVTSLSGEFRLSKRQVTALLGKIGVRICSGSVCKIHERASEILGKPYEEIKEYTLRKKHLNADETSWKTLNQKRWIWIGHADDSVFFSIKSARSSQAFHEVFGNYKGGLTTDRFGAYNSHEGVRQLCWSHADRDFEQIASREGVDKFIGTNLLECKKVVFDLWHQLKAKQIDRSTLIQQIEGGPKDQMNLLLKMGAAHEDCRSKTRATCIDFYNRFESLWIFVYTEGVEPTNNLAERGLRGIVIKRKLSFGSQSDHGEQFVERVMTVAMTLQMQAINSLQYFTECFKLFVYKAQAPPIFAS